MVKWILCVSFLFFIWGCSSSKGKSKKSSSLTTAMDTVSGTAIQSMAWAPPDTFEARQIAIVQQQVWENLRKVPGTDRDYTSTVTLRIANGNITDAQCTLIFPASSWELSSIFVDEYKTVLRNTSPKIFAVFYRLITNENVKASEILINGLWRPFLGSHVHIQGRGIDIGSIKGATGEAVIFNSNSSGAENDFGRKVRNSLTSNFPITNQYLSPWIMCNPVSSCSPNSGSTQVERIHKTHLHLTLTP